MLWKSLLLKTSAQLVFFLWLVKSLNNLKIIELLITSKKSGLFYFQYDFRSSVSTADLETGVSDRMSMVF